MFNACMSTTTMPDPDQARGMAVPPAGPGGWEQCRPGSDEWVAPLAHELRSPLATILLALEVLAGGRDLGPDTRQVLDRVERQARNAMRLIDDLFDFCAGARGTL